MLPFSAITAKLTPYPGTVSRRKPGKWSKELYRDCKLWLSLPTNQKVFKTRSNGFHSWRMKTKSTAMESAAKAQNPDDSTEPAIDAIMREGPFITDTSVVSDKIRYQGPARYAPEIMSPEEYTMYIEGLPYHLAALEYSTMAVTKISRLEPTRVLVRWRVEWCRQDDTDPFSFASEGFESSVEQNMKAVVRGTSIFVTDKSKTKIIEHIDVWDLSELRDLPDQEIFSTVMDFVFCWRPTGSFRFIPKVFEEAVKVAAWQVLEVSDDIALSREEVDSIVIQTLYASLAIGLILTFGIAKLFLYYIHLSLRL